jgi:3-deoxy-D-manno-octulosonic-acid transferase
MGPHTFNFSEVALAAEKSGAALRVANMSDAVEAACELALNAEHQSALASKAQQFAQAHGGATQRTALAVLDCLTQIKDSTAR